MPSETHRRLLLQRAYPNLDPAQAVQLLHRVVGLDPDGPLVPMQPFKTDHQQLDEMLAEGERHTRDCYIINALRFT